MFEIENLTYTYPDRAAPALEDIHFAIGRGEFVIVTGKSGCGKSTLARLLGGFIPEYYGGTVRGSIRFEQKDLLSLPASVLRRKIGVVFQEPERQTILNQVENDLAFGLENLGVTPSSIKRSIAEVSAYLDIGHLLDRNTDTLSGGEKQKVAIASILAMSREVLILDEPTSQLDPIASHEILRICRRLHRDLGLTLILIEQRLDESLHLADRILHMEQGRISCDLPPRDYATWAIERNNPLLPKISKLFAPHVPPPFPLTLHEGRELLPKFNIPTLPPLPLPTPSQPTEETLSVRRVSYRYHMASEALRSVSLTAHKGEILALLGENGAGKSTLLQLLQGFKKPNTGRILVKGGSPEKITAAQRPKTLGFLSQYPNDYLFNETVEAELAYTLKNVGQENTTLIDRTLQQLDISHLKERNPRQLSAGERQRVALASVLVAQPEILLVDEASRGLDPELVEELGAHFRRLADDEGTTILLVTQDLEFAAEIADRVGLLFRGELVALDRPEAVFRDGFFFSPMARKLFRDRSTDIINFTQAREALRTSKAQ